MIIPIRTSINSDYNTNRISWAMVPGVTRFWPSDDGDSLSFARDETTTTSVRFSPAVNSCLQFGTERCWGVNGRTILDCTNQLMDWLLSFETIPYKTDRSLSGGMSGTIPGGYKSSPKSSGSKSKPSKRGKRGKSGPTENSFSEEL